MNKIPIISTRGYYDLETGKTLKDKKYFLYTKKSFTKILNSQEVVIMIHGLRNNRQGAVEKFKIAKKRLQFLGYKFPVIGFSYDSNTKGAHLKKFELKALRVGQKIANKNGRNLSEFISDFKKQNSIVKIRLMGHSLGTQVIISTLAHLHKKSSQPLIESVYFFGSSVPSADFKNKKRLIENTIRTKLVNYYCPYDDVLKQAHLLGLIKKPLGLYGVDKPFSKYIQFKVMPQNHRFVSYAKTLKQFP